MFFVGIAKVNCESKGKWTHLDRFNRIITFAATENGATPKHPNDRCNASFYVMGMPKFAIDNREEIYINRRAENFSIDNRDGKKRVQKEEEAERKRQAQAKQEWMLKRDAEEVKKQLKKQEDEEVERKRQEGQRLATEMMRQNRRLTWYW
jgi:flagellar biosynthesis GTPase FlhF